MTSSLCLTGAQVVSSYLQTTLGHSYLTACKGKGPGNGIRERIVALQRRENLLTSAVQQLPLCKILMQKRYRLLLDKNYQILTGQIFFSAMSYICSNNIHQVTVTRIHWEKLSLHKIMAFPSQIMVIICMLCDRKPNKTTVCCFYAFAGSEISFAVAG